MFQEILYMEKKQRKYNINDNVGKMLEGTDEIPKERRKGQRNIAPISNVL